MIKSLGILIGGIFVGAVGAEIVRKKYSKPLNDVYAKTCEITSGVKEALKRDTPMPCRLNKPWQKVFSIRFNRGILTLLSIVQHSWKRKRG